jgi:glycosyltransferase involved in cell wall biosynthesis
MSAPIRVLFLLNSLGMGGAEKQVLSLLQHLDGQRFTLGLIYLRNETRLLHQLPQERLALVSTCNASSYLDLTAVRRLVQQIDAFAPDVVVCTNSWSLLYASLARRWVRAGFGLVEVFHTTVLQTFKQRMQMSFYRHLFRACDQLIYVCRNQQAYWRRAGLRAAAEEVIHNGIDTAHFVNDFSPVQQADLRKSVGLGVNSYLIGACASLRPEKAHQDLLQAVRRLRDRGIDAQALLIGDGSERRNIEQCIERLGLQHDVVITGFQNDVRPYIAACDIMVLTSHAIETFSIAALEAMSMGKPMVMSRLGGADEQIQEGVNGYLYAPGDLESLTVKLAQLADADTRAPMGLAAAALVRSQFTVQRMTAAFAICFERLTQACSSVVRRAA